MSRYRSTGLRAVFALALALLLAAGVAACGGSSSSSSEGGGTTAGGGTTTGGETVAANEEGGSGGSPTASIPFTGAEAKLPSSYPAPKIKSGFTYTAGFLSPNASIGELGEIEKAAVEETERLGGKVITEDAGFSPEKQASQFADLLAQHVDVVMAYPVVPETLNAAVKQAEQQGVPVVSEDTPPDPSEGLLPGYATNVLQGRDRATYEIAKALAEEAPGSNFALLGNAQPVPLLHFAMERSKYWAEKFGLKYIGEEDLTTDSAGAAQQAATALLAKYPEVENIITYNDAAAEAAAQVARSSGKGSVRVAGCGGDASAFKLIEAGVLWGTYSQPLDLIGRELARASYNLLTDQHLPLAEQIATPGGEVITKANVAEAEPSNPG